MLISACILMDLSGNYTSYSPKCFDACKSPECVLLFVWITEMGTVAYRSRFTTEPSLNLGCSSTLSHWMWTCLRCGDGLGGGGWLLLLQTLYLMELDCTCLFLTWCFRSSNHRAERFPPLHNPQCPAWHTLPLRPRHSLMIGVVLFLPFLARKKIWL